MIPKPRLITDLIIENGNAIYDAGSKSGFMSVTPAMATFVGTPPEPLDALDASVTLNIDGASSSASIRLPKGMNIDGRAYVEMFTVNGSAGIFRTRSPQIGYGNNSTTLQLEHSINQLGDYIIADKIQEQLTVRKAFEKIFQYYGDKGVQQLWMLGAVDDPRDNDVEDWEVKCVLDVDYDNCLDAVLGVMEQYPTMMLEFDFSNRPWVLNVRNRPQVVTAEARLSRNVKSALVTRDDSELFTRVYMDGYKNKNGKYGHYDSTSGKKKYGLIETVISGANDTAAIAQRTVKSYMRNHKNPRISVTIDGIELSQITGEQLDRFTIGKMMRLALPDYGETVSETITSLAFPSVYKQPNSVTVTMNSEEDRVIRYIKKAQKSASKAAKSAAAVGKAAIVGAEVINANTLQLTWGNGETLNFSKAVTLRPYPSEKRGWAGGTYTAKAYQKNTVNGKEVEKEVGSISTKISSIDLQANKTPTVDGKKINIPLKVMYNNDGYKGNTEFTQTFTVDGTPLFNAGWKDAASKVTIPPTISGTTIKAAVAVSYPLAIGSGATQSNQKISETYTMMADLIPTSNTKVNLWRANAQGVAIGVVARIDVGNVWNAGWDNAAGMVELPPVIESGETASTFTLKYPIKEGSNRYQTQYGFQLYATTPSSTGYAVVSHGVQVHGRISIGNYYTTGWNAGWDNAAGLVVLPSVIESGETASTFTLKYPLNDGNNRQQTQYGFQLYTSSSTPSSTGYAVVSHGVQVHGRISIGNWYTEGRKAATVTLSHGSVTTDSQYQKYVTYSATNYYNTDRKAEKTLYLVKSGNKAQLRETSATGTLVMEINTT